MIKKQGVSKERYVKGVAPVIGFLLIVAIIFLAAAQYQANVVPVQERQQEADHFSKATQQMSGLRTEIIRTASSGRPQTQNIDVGMRYNVLGLNQPPVPGVLMHIDTNNDIEIHNATNNDVASNFWRADQPRSYETGIISYRIGYNRFSGAGELYIEHGYLYRDTQPSVTPRTAYNNDDIPIRVINESDQPIVNGRTITLYTIQDGIENGNLTASGISTSTVELSPSSAPMNTLTLTDEGDPISFTLPTRLHANQWEKIFAEEMSTQDGYIRDVKTSNESNIIEDGSRAVEVVMEPNETYNLRMSLITMQTLRQRTSFDRTEPQYVAVENPIVNVREESSINLEAQVRDKYNNGVIGQQVFVEARTTDSGECIGDFRNTAQVEPNCINENNRAEQPGVDVSDDNGIVRYTYDSPEISNDRDVTFIYEISN